MILLGEHAVVYGRRALAAGLGTGLTVEIDRGAGPAVSTDLAEQAADPRPTRLLVAAAAHCGIAARTLVARVRSTLPAGVGFGSSAALTVAMLRAVAMAAGRVLVPAEELAFGRELEGIFHGRSSGIDPAAAALGGCFAFLRGEPPVVSPVRSPIPLPLVLAWSGGRRTQATVGGLRERWTADPQPYEAIFDRIGEIVGEGERAVCAGDLAALGAAFDANQRELQRLGVSTADLEARAQLARDSGALGAKLTGGGGGGAIVALAPDPARVVAALERVGLGTRVVMIGGGVEEGV